MSTFNASTLLSGLPAVQKVGANWQLKGSVKVGPGGIPLTDLKQIPPGIGSLILIRKTDALSAHLRNAMLSKLTVPLVIITTKSGTSVDLTRAQVTNIRIVPPDDWTAMLSPAVKHSSSKDTNEQEEVTFTFQKIELGTGGTPYQDSWDATS